MIQVELPIVHSMEKTEKLNHQSRVESIDLMRGIVMIIMAIDHVRDLFHSESFMHSPVDINHTTAALFFTRWITHLCAPTFILLAGTSAYFIARRKALKDTAFFLITRGLWLVVLQLTIVRFAWNFDPLFRFNSSSIISIIGLCMILLAGLIYLPTRTILIIGLILVTGHNLLDDISFKDGTMADVVWSFLHVQKSFDLGNGYSFGFYYPIIPWIGVMALGYCLGHLYDVEYSSEKRKKSLLLLGALSLSIFGGFRYFNIYGDPVPWNSQPETATTLISFFNLQKYPPSLLYLSATLGISFVLLAVMEGKNLSRWKPVTLFGKVALFYYVLHLFLIHILAVVAALLTGLPWQSMIFPSSVANGTPWLKGRYGFSLAEVYMVWISIILILYPLCVYWNSFKMWNKQKWWASYV